MRVPCKGCRDRRQSAPKLLPEKFHEVLISFIPGDFRVWDIRFQISRARLRPEQKPLQEASTGAA
jgi:hypothetical protein